ncbi:Eco57I restriction-modification methylase domain-containing protein [Ruicaihuangia caeni]|uniref:Eco57I restriction-modification methylase domain-containing protein n=1 Tax=Ruicaihuangia caeni TaxID=3042517 RepID=UPI00338D983B
MTYSEDTAVLRKARGAFFTPPAIARHIADWAIRSASDRVLEPSAGDAEFMLAAVARLRGLNHRDLSPVVDGVEIHDYSACVGRQRVLEAGGTPRITVSDFFLVEPSPEYDAVIGNPPYIRYQDFTGEARVRSRAAALRAGVALTGLASSWAAFAVHSALFLKKGGRLGLVLPAELLSVNYAAPVRQFLFDNFKTVDLVLFDEQVFPEAEADVVLLQADGFGQGPASHATFRQSRNAGTLGTVSAATRWTPLDPADKWTGSIVNPNAVEPLQSLKVRGAFTDLEVWGATTLGIVTGNNKFFTLSPERAKNLGLEDHELLSVSPPGSAHLRGLSLSRPMLNRLGREGRATYLFKPGAELSQAAQKYVKSGEHAGVNAAYKCRMRKVWYQVPILEPADLLLTCMNADTPRLTTNAARARHLNSVHGVYLSADVRMLGRDLLPIASLNSITLLNAEMVGRTYGGGILKIEPREADRWAMPSPALVKQQEAQLRALKPSVARLLKVGRLLDAVALVDDVLLIGSGLVPDVEVQWVRNAQRFLSRRRTSRGTSSGGVRMRAMYD